MCYHSSHRSFDAHSDQRSRTLFNCTIIGQRLSGSTKSKESKCSRPSAAQIGLYKRKADEGVGRWVRNRSLFTFTLSPDRNGRSRIIRMRRHVSGNGGRGRIASKIISFPIAAGVRSRNAVGRWMLSTINSGSPDADKRIEHTWPWNGTSDRCR